MSEKTRLIAQCKRIDPGFMIEEAVVPQGSMFRVVLGDGTTMHMQFPKGTYSRAQMQNIKLQMLREALIALRFVPKEAAASGGVEMQMDPKRVEFGADGVAREVPKCSA